MSTHDDYNIADQTGTSLLADLNSLLDALRSSSSDGSQPAVFGDYQLWLDTGSNILKMNAPGIGVINICNIDTGLFFDVTSVTNADTLTGLSLTNDANNADLILKRDSNGSIIGDQSTDGTFEGDAPSLGTLTNDTAYLLDGANKTGTVNADALAGTLFNFEVRIGNMFKNLAHMIDKVSIKPFRGGVVRLQMEKTTVAPTIVIYRETVPGSPTTWNTIASQSVDITLNQGEAVVIEIASMTVGDNSRIYISTLAEGSDEPSGGPFIRPLIIN